MAIFSVTTSGVLNFAYTGLGNPVSTFASEGISTSAIASSPISGNNPKIWTIGPPNYFTSSGGLVVVSVNLGTQSGLAASSIGEYPLSGIVDNIPEVNASLGFVTAAEVSNGNLVISGNTTSIKAYNFDSAGNLLLIGNSTYQTLQFIDSTGNLLVNGTTVSRITLLELTAGNLVIDTTNTYNINLKEPTAGNLVINGTDFVQKVYNKTSAGNLVIPTTSVSRITLNEISTGNLVVVDKVYNMLYTGGIADYQIASAPIAAGPNNPTVQQAQISFYGDIESSGNLVITPVGEFVESLANSGVLAGAALADQTIGGGMDTIFRSTGYKTTLNFSTDGNLIISGSTGVNNDYVSHGNLLISGTDFVTKTVNFDTDGNLVVNGTDSTESTLNKDTSGNLDISGTTVVSKTLGFLSSGNLQISGTTGFNNDYVSNGNLLISGTTAIVRELGFPSQGNLVVTGSSFQNRTIAEYSTGNLIITPIGEFIEPLSDSSGIAGAAIAGIPIGGGSDTVYHPSLYEDLWNEDSAGNLTIAGTDTTSSIRNQLSFGNLIVTGSDEQISLRNEITAGNLVISGNITTSATLNFDSVGELLFTPVGWKSTASISGTIAGSAMATTPIGGDEMENNVAVVQVSYISGGIYYPGNVAYAVSNGNILLNGTDTVEFVESSNLISEGNLIITGSTVDEYIPANQNISSDGNLIITGSTTVQVIIVPPVPKQKTGGSYVFASSWDILKPYFPDDRHILGYIQGEVGDKPRRRKISGSTEFAVIRGNNKPQPKFGFLKDISNVDAKPKVKLVPKIQENRFFKQIMLEDEMLINGSLLLIDDPDDELERELMR